MSRVPLIEAELRRVFSDVSGLSAGGIAPEARFVDQGLDSLSLTQATLEIERVFGVRLRLRRLLEDLDNTRKLAALLDAEMPAERLAPPAAGPGDALHAILQQQLQLMSRQLALLAGAPVAPVVSATPDAAPPAPLAAPAVAAARVAAPLAHASVSVSPSAAPATRPVAADFAAPANATEHAIAAVWARLLGVTHVGRNDNFFNLGGHSMLALRATQAMQRITGEKISVQRLIFESLSQIAAPIAIEPAPAAPSDALAADAHAPVRFGHPASTLYGVFHPSASGSARPRAVLFCNPFGQEAVRIHRFFRVLADRLARAGVACLRFDYHASGESLGDDHDADLDRWVQDVLAADALLRQRAGVQAVDWVAPRLASALAVRASVQAPQAPQQLVLWEPVLVGARYVEHLQAVHASAVADLPDGGALAGDEEILGFGVSPRLLAQMRAVAPADYQRARARRIVWIAARQQATDTDEWVAALQGRGVAVRRQTLSLDFDWTSEEAFNTALVPTDALNLLAVVLGGDKLE